MKNYDLILLLCLSLFFYSSCNEHATNHQSNEKLDSVPYSWLFVGTYTKKEGHVDGQAEGIYVLKMNVETGVLTPVTTIKGIINPSYLTLHPNGKNLYAVQELADNSKDILGKISAFSMDLAQEKFELLNEVSAQGNAPCHLSLDPSGKFVLVANYVMGTVASFAVLENGQLSEALSVHQHERKTPEAFRQEAAHAHMITPGMQGKGIFAVDLGTDEIIHYQLDSLGQLQKLATTSVKAGSGCRHFVFHPSQPWCYVLHELSRSIEVFSYENPARPMTPIQMISTLDKPIEVGTIYSAAIKIHPSGKFLYASNRGLQGNSEQSIAIYQIDSSTGQLFYLGSQNTKGLVPRDFEIDPSGKFLLVANQDSNTIVTFNIHPDTGLLEDTGVVMEVKTPVCLKFL